MPLDYKNLPLLLTVGEVAEMFRCSTGTVRTKVKADPNWLKPVRHALMRKQLFATADVLAVLGQATPASSPSDLADPWDPDAAAEAIERAKRDRIRAQISERGEREVAERRAWSARVTAHEPTARAHRVWTRDKKMRLEVSADGEAFRFWLHFQPRFCPPGWPGVVPIPRRGPEWVRLQTEAEADGLASDIGQVMAEYQPQWDAVVAERKRLRRATKASG